MLKLNDFLDVFKGFQVGVILLNQNSYIVYINPALLSAANFKEDELLGQSFDLLKKGWIYENTRTDGVYYDSIKQVYVISKGKYNKYVSLNEQDIQIENKTYNLIIFNDITTDFEKKMSLAIELERITEAKNLAKLGHWELDLTNDSLYWSDEVYKLFDVNKEKFGANYTTFLNMIHPDDRDSVNNSYLNSVKDRTEYEINHRVIFKGEIRYYKEKGKTFYSGDTPLKSIGTVQDITDEIEKELIIKTKEEELLKSQSVIIRALINITELRDKETGRHISATRKYIIILLDAMKENSKYDLTESKLKKIITVTPLHDIGKINISDKVLLKKGKFTDEEYVEIKKHPFLGWDALRKARDQSGDFESEILDIAQNIILYHHERWDGKGYPNNLSGLDIPIEGRVMALVDVYDALVSKRVYKPAYSHEESIEIIKFESGKHFDPEIVRCFFIVEDKFKEALLSDFSEAIRLI